MNMEQSNDIQNIQSSLFTRQSIKSPSSQLKGLGANLIGTEGLFKWLDTEKVPYLNQSDYGQKVEQLNNEGVKVNETGRVKLFRFLVCSLGLMSVTLALMCRVILNVAIVEIAIRSEVEMEVEVKVADEQLKEQLVEIADLPTTNYPGQESTTISDTVFNNDTTTSTIHPNWSRNDQSFVLSSFYFGYAPAMFFAGGLADMYGSKFLILVSLLGGAIMNLATPYLANHSYSMLVASRITMGVFQGAVVPACFDLFNRWLIPSEKGIFAAMIKLSLAAGSVVGGLVCVLVVRLGLTWHVTFYLTGFFGLMYSIAWIILASNEPEGNRFLKETTKKSQSMELSMQAEYGEDKIAATKDQKETKESAPVFLIITNMSVIVLGIVKLSIGVGIDFTFSMLSIYLHDAHSASNETIGIVVSSGPFFQMLLITPVAWLAKYVIERESCGLSRTKWRKIFQGIANLSMSLAYFLLTLVSHSLSMVIFLVLVICIGWVFSAGGEAMVPYDLSIKYPATIMGFTHSFSILSGIIVPSLTSVVVGNTQDNNPEIWNKLFFILSGFLFIGGLLFVFVLKSKPFLPGEKEESKKQPISNSI